MAKYDWEQLEKEYILGDYKSVSAFLRDKGIKSTDGNSKKATKGWKQKKAQVNEKKRTKTIEKFIEKEAEIEAQQMIDIKIIANSLALKIQEAIKQLDSHLATEKVRTRKVKYDRNVMKPEEETIEEKVQIKSYTDIIDKKGLKELTTALKNINDILVSEPEKIKLKKEELKLKEKRLNEDIW